MNRKQRLTAILFSAFLGFSLAGTAPAQDFDAGSIAGTWTLFVQGFVSENGFIDQQGLAPGLTPLVAIATVTFDGDDSCQSIDQIVAGGLRVPSPADPSAFRVASACTYTVNANGTGFFQVTFPALGPVPESTTTATIVITDNDEMHFIAENSGIGIFGGGVMKRQTAPE